MGASYADHCVFCNIVAGEIPSAKVYESDTVLAFRDNQPVAPTHILIIPKKHIASVADMEAEDIHLIGELVYAARLVAEQEGISDGFRLVINSGRRGGQHIFHVHLHMLGGRGMSWPPG